MNGDSFTDEDDGLGVFRGLRSMFLIYAAIGVAFYIINYVASL